MSSGRASFQPSSAFAGKKVGYFFRNGDKGIGYYLDPRQEQDLNKEEFAQNASLERKRKFDALKPQSDHNSGIKENNSNDEATIDINEILEQADKVDITQLDGNGVKQLLGNLEKKISKNQKMRIKHSEEPEKFMESEFELHKEIEDFHIVAAFPELYSILIQNNAVNTLFGLITHENTDISIAAISLLQEMTEVDTLMEQPIIAKDFVNAVIKIQGFELLVQNLSRLDESNDEDAQGVHNTMAIFENILEIQAEISIHLCEKTYLLSFLLNRLRVKTFDANKLYCSEILSILLQSDIKNRKILLHLPTASESSAGTSYMNGLEMLLESIAIYRKKEVDIADEQECVENLFLCLCSALMLRENQDAFLQLEGFELMMRCLQEQKYAAGCVLNAVNYAITKHLKSCERFVDCGGLKYIFPVLAGKGLKKSLKKKGGSHGEKRNLEQVAISIIAQLCTQLYHSSNPDYKARIALKLVEQNFEKLLLCCELYDKYFKILEKTESTIEDTKQRLMAEGDMEALLEFEDEDYIYIQRLDGGLFVLQQIAMVIGFACTMERGCLDAANAKLKTVDSNLLDVLGVLQDLMQNIGEEATSEGGKLENVNQGIDSSYKLVIKSWSEIVGNYVSTN